MTALILSNISWVQFIIFFLIAALVWIAWIYKDELLGKGPPPSASQPETKRIWQVSEVPQNVSEEPNEKAGKGPKVPFNTLDFDDDNEPGTTQGEHSEGAEFGEMDDMIGLIEKVITDNRNAGKEAIINELKPVFQQYAALGRTSLKKTIDNFTSILGLKEAGISIDTNILWP